jgi:hypothetical protein
MQLRTYLLLILYATAAAAIGAAWLIAKFDPTAGHGELMENIRQRNAEIQRQIDGN